MALLFLKIIICLIKGNTIQHHIYPMPLKLNVNIRYVFWPVALHYEIKLSYVMLCYVIIRDHS